MRALLIAALLLTVAIAAVPAADAQPTVGPGVGQFNAVTKPCWDDDLVCVWFSLQVPQCVENPF